MTKRRSPPPAPSDTHLTLDDFPAFDQTQKPVGRYVYQHILTSTGKPFLTEVGTGNRAWERNRGRSGGWDFIANQGYLVRIIADDLTASEASALLTLLDTPKRRGWRPGTPRRRGKRPE